MVCNKALPKAYIVCGFAAGLPLESGTDSDPTIKFKTGSDSDRDPKRTSSFDPYSHMYQQHTCN